MTSPWIRRIALGVGALALLIVLLAIWLVTQFDAERYKSLAIDHVRETYQRRLAIDGSVDLSLFPRLAVKVGGLRLSEHNSEQTFVSIDEAALAVQVLPLLRQQLVVDRVYARGVRARHTRDADGRRNIDDLLTPSADPADDTGSARTMQFDIAELQLEDVQLSMNDAQLPLDGEITLRELKTGRLAPRTPAAVTLAARVVLNQPQPVALDLRGKLTLTLDPGREAISATDLQLQIDGDAADAKGLALTLDGALAWDGQAASAGPLRLQIASAQHGAITLAPSTLSLTRAFFDPQKERLSLNALHLALVGRQGEQGFELGLEWPELAVEAEKLTGSAVSGRLNLSGPTTLQGSFGSAAPSGSFKSLRLPTLALALKGSTGGRPFDGKLQADLELQIERRSAVLSPINLQASFTDPGLKPLQLALEGRAQAGAESAEWKLQGSINQNRFDSQGRAELAAAVPRVEAQARFDTLDLNRLLAPEPPAASSGGGAPNDTPVALDGLNAVDGRFSFSAGTLDFRQYHVGDARLEATLNKGALTVSRLSGQAWGGSVVASGSAQAAHQRMAVRLDASGVDVNALLKDVAGKDLLEGRGRVGADLQTQGATLGALRSALAGSATLQLRDGAVKGVNLARALRQAKAALSLKTDAVSKASATEKTDFSELTASARISDGVAVSDDLELKSPFLRIGGDGRFDIGRGRIDYTARTTVVAVASGQGSAELDALRGVTVPVRLSGPFDAIDWQIQWSAVAADVVKEKLKDKLTEKLGARLGLPAPDAASAPAKTKDRLKDALKGLLR